MIPLPGGGGFLPPDEVALLAKTVCPVIRQRWQRDGFRQPPGQLAAVLDSIDRQAAEQHVSATPLPTFAPGGAPAGRSAWLTTGEAAKRLGVSPRQVLHLVAVKALVADRPDGRRAWRVAVASVDAERERRRSRGTQQSAA